MDTVPDASARPVNTGRVIVLLALAAFASACAFRICDPLLPQLSREFGVSTGEAAHAVTLFTVAYGVFQFLFGPVGDRYGKYLTITAATLLCAVGSIGVALAPSMDAMVLARLVSGAAGAGIVPLSMAWIGDNVEYAERQATLARFVSGTILGMAAGQLIGGVFADTLGWRWAFVFLACIYLCVGALLAIMRPPRQSQATGAGAGFLRPMAEVIATPWARVVLATVFVEGALVFGVLAFVPAYLQIRFGLGPTAAGAVGGIFALGGIAYVVIARRLVAALGESGLVAAGGLTLAVAFALYALGPAWSWSVLAGLACGFGFYMFHNTLQTNATQMMPARRGTAVALFACFLFLGQSAGVASGALLVDGVGAHWLFWGAAALIPLLGWAFSAALGRRKGR
ncbi:MFS transporter [Orrella sp. JC864]|uniref:MFS transporter n=1 Tax=Orrella sp. JC864 TaxID=3120298 RepID=UPI00300B94F6